MERQRRRWEGYSPKPKKRLEAAGDPSPGASGGSTAPCPVPWSPASGTVKEYVSAVARPLFRGHG